jgi:hypothetical protein
MATDFSDLIPVRIASELIAAAERESVAMRLGNVQRMPAGIESAIPTDRIESLEQKAPRSAESPSSSVLDVRNDPTRRPPVFETQGSDCKRLDARSVLGRRVGTHAFGVQVGSRKTAIPSCFSRGEPPAPKEPKVERRPACGAPLIIPTGLRV